MRFSLVIPAYNEAELLPRLLDTVTAAREAFDGGAAQIQVIVADNGSTDETAAIATKWGAVVQPVQKRVIAAVRNGGAAAAEGEIVCFTDADMQIHPQTFNRIDEAMRTQHWVCGATGVTLETMSIGLAVTYCAMMPLVFLMRMDTGVVFCRREDFARVGGYPEERLFAEDVAFLLKMRRLGRSRRPRQRLVRIRGCKAVSSTRKFHEHGQWHYFTMSMRWGLAMLGIGDEKTIAERYWYDVDR